MFFSITEVLQSGPAVLVSAKQTIAKNKIPAYEAAEEILLEERQLAFARNIRNGRAVSLLSPLAIMISTWRS
jgi:uncharacterized protein YheU (UPF0270 family)